MAAVAGVFQRDGSAVDAVRLARVADALALFGPRVDQWRNGPAGLLCRSASSIPAGLDDCRLVRCAEDDIVLFHGFLHARDELADAVKAGRAANQRTDAELFALAWELWKEEAFERVLGDFAAVVWAPGRHRLLASCSYGRPPPLYYWVDRDSAVVATAPRGVLAWNGSPRGLNDEHLAACLAGDLSDLSGTCWHDVSSLPSGETLTVTTATHRVRRWHVLGTPVRDGPRAASSADYVEATRTLLRRVVGGATRAPETPAILLSAGLDSTAVALAALDALAGTPGAAPLLSVTMRPAPDWDQDALPDVLTDEWPLVREVAKTQPLLDARFGYAADTKWDRGMERRFELAEAPPVRYGGFAFVARCCEMARQEGRRVLLDGSSGNATFSFDGWRRLAELLKSGRALALWKAARPRPRLLWGQALLPLLPTFVQERFPHQFHGHQRWGEGTILHPAFARRFNLAETANERRRRALARSVREAQQIMLNGFAARSCEIRSNEMASQVFWGVARRSPLRDRRFVEWCLSLPSAQYMENGATRLLAKRLLRGRVPDEMLSDRRGFQNADWHMRLTPEVSAIREEVAEWRRYPAVAERLDVGRLARVLETWPDWASWSRRDHPDWRLAHNLTEAVAMGRFILWAERT